MPGAPNPLVDDRLTGLLLEDFVRPAELCAVPSFAEHTPETFALYVDAARRVARDVLWPSYRPMDTEPPTFEGGRVRVHPAMRKIYPTLVELGLLTASRPAELGGGGLPLSVTALGNAYLMAANGAAAAFAWLTSGAAHLLEAFGSPWLRETFMAPMYAGRFTGTMALTEPGAGSSLADVATRATPADGGAYRLVGSKMFISGGDHDLAENIVHLVLARIEGAPPGVRGISLFAVPARRPERGTLVDNGVTTSGLIHKIGWRGLPSVALELGERGGTHGWLVGEPHRGLAQMFQMMNESRIMVGLCGAATASVAHHASVEYARARRQGRGADTRDPSAPPVPIIEHADVRRLLVRQKAIVEGALALLVTTARHADLAAHGQDAGTRARSQALLDLLTPIAKSFPAEHGYEATTIAVQIHGGYGYSSEFLVESWMRDQKLNSIHEGTTGIQALDLVGRKLSQGGGTSLRVLGEEILAECRAAERAGVSARAREAVAAAWAEATRVAEALLARGGAGDLAGQLRHATDVLELFAVVVVGWQWLALARAATTRLRAASAASTDHARGLLQAAEYWFTQELSRAPSLAERALREDDGYGAMRAEWF